MDLNALAIVCATAPVVAATVATQWVIRRGLVSPYTCIRCNKARVKTFPARCAVCENKVTEIMFNAAVKGHRLEDPMTKLRNLSL